MSLPLVPRGSGYEEGKSPTQIKHRRQSGEGAWGLVWGTY